ncbi:hypothetical protein K438DRAFT_1992030 [Mycena galopus ATCC 62051]|nr:hypothetical protein K438DRAFT_1992030 [Mycena galopus ATCC 62051]
MIRDTAADLAISLSRSRLLSDPAAKMEEPVFSQWFRVLPFSVLHCAPCASLPPRILVSTRRSSPHNCPLLSQQGPSTHLGRLPQRWRLYLLRHSSPLLHTVDADHAGACVTASPLHDKIPTPTRSPNADESPRTEDTRSKANATHRDRNNITEQQNRQPSPSPNLSPLHGRYSTLHPPSTSPPSTPRARRPLLAVYRPHCLKHAQPGLHGTAVTISCFCSARHGCFSSPALFCLLARHVPIRQSGLSPAPPRIPNMTQITPDVLNTWGPPHRPHHVDRLPARRYCFQRFTASAPSHLPSDTGVQQQMRRAFPLHRTAFIASTRVPRHPMTPQCQPDSHPRAN